MKYEKKKNERFQIEYAKVNFQAIKQQECQVMMYFITFFHYQNINSIIGMVQRKMNDELHIVNCFRNGEPMIPRKYLL